MWYDVSQLASLEMSEVYQHHLLGAGCSTKPLQVVFQPPTQKSIETAKTLFEVTSWCSCYIPIYPHLVSSIAEPPILTVLTPSTPILRNLHGCWVNLHWCWWNRYLCWILARRSCELNPTNFHVLLIKFNNDCSANFVLGPQVKLKSLSGASNPRIPYHLLSKHGN